MAEKRQGAVNSLCVDDMVVVENEHKKRNVARGDFVCQQCEDGLDFCLLPALREQEQSIAKLWVELLKCAQHIAQKASWMIILRFEGEPERRHLLLLKPLSQNGCFPEAGRRGNQGQRSLNTALYLLDQVSACNEWKW